MIALDKLTVLILGHHLSTHKITSSPRGEMANAHKVNGLLNHNGYKSTILDILELFGNSISALKKYYFPIGILNMDLAKAGQTLIEEVGLKKIKHQIHRAIGQFQPEVLLILSWECSLAALFSTGIQFNWPIISKLYVHTQNEIVSKELFEPSSLLITESLHGSTRAIASGIPPWKVVYFPHPIFPFKKRAFKRKGSAKDLIVIGAITRLIMGKNCEYMLEVVKRLHDEGFPVLLRLKGDFDPFNQHQIYKVWLKKLLSSLKQETWLSWERKYTPYEKMDHFYQEIDILLHLSGFESGSNVIVEALANKKPTLILETPTNISLFKNGALFVKKFGQICNFAIPDKEELYQKLKLLIVDSKQREMLAESGYVYATEHFSASFLQKRIPLILEAAKNYHAQRSCDRSKREIEKLYTEDLKREKWFSTG